MAPHDLLAVEFEGHRPHLKAVAYRMLGSLTEAEDAVQEGWLRLAHTDTGDIGNLAGWLTTVVSRVCWTCSAPAKGCGRSHWTPACPTR